MAMTVRNLKATPDPRLDLRIEQTLACGHYLLGDADRSGILRDPIGALVAYTAARVLEVAAKGVPLRPWADFAFHGAWR
jgi:hypothetical protein